MSPEDPRHGTPAGYETHKRAGERPCDPCRKAKNAAERERRARTRPPRPPQPETEQIGLTGGRWVTVGGIQRWIKDAPEKPVPPKLERAQLRPAPMPTEITQLVACPRCRATLAQPCKTESGNSTTHTERIVPRRCPCGQPVEPRKTYCQACRDRRRRETYRQREITTPTALRRRERPNEAEESAAYHHETRRSA